MGSWDQSIIEGFNDITAQKDQNTEITSSPFTYTTTGDVDAVELQMRFPGGLYRTDAYASFLPYECEIKYRYRTASTDGSYGAYTNVTFSAETRSQYNVMERIEFPSSDTYQIEITRVTAADGLYSTSICYLQTIVH